MLFARVCVYGAALERKAELRRHIVVGQYRGIGIVRASFHDTTQNVNKHFFR